LASPAPIITVIRPADMFCSVSIVWNNSAGPRRIASVLTVMPRFGAAAST
jgi:hypothetical protein